MRHGIVLRPQPSDDPNDPLNWSSFRKHMAMASISWLALVCYLTVTALVPATLTLAIEFGVTKGTAVYLGNTPVALYAVGPLLWSPLSHFIGRRPVLLLCNMIAIIGTAVAASAQTYGTCMAGRVILGLGGSAFWTLGPAAIGDIVSADTFPASLANYSRWILCATAKPSLNSSSDTRKERRWAYRLSPLSWRHSSAALSAALS